MQQGILVKKRIYQLMMIIQSTKQHDAWTKWLAWLLASASVVILLVKYAQPVSDSDVWWHIVLGQRILATGSLIIDHSIFTWTPAIPHNTYNAWIAEVILYLVYAKMGAVGLIALRYIVLGGFFALAAYFAIQRGVATNPLAWVIIIVGSMLAFAATLVKPELFSFVFMCITVWLYFCIRNIGVKAWALCYLFPLIVIMWVNTHGAFVLSALFFISIGLGEVLNVGFGSPKAMPAKLRIHFFLALALCLPALLVNPYGYALPLDILSGNYLSVSALETFSHTNKAYWPTSAYNTPPNYAIDYLFMAIVIYIFLLWQLLKNQQIDFVSILAFLAYTYLFVQFARSTYPLAPVFVFIQPRAIGYQNQFLGLATHHHT